MLSYASYTALVDKWHNDTMLLSYHDMKHMAFQELLSQGKDIIPYVIKDLFKRDSFLPILLLGFILGTDNNYYLTRDMAGNHSQLTDAWIKYLSEDNEYAKFMVLY